MHGHKKNVNAKIDSFIPKNEMRQQIELVSDFLFLLFFVDSNKQDNLANNN